MSLQDFQRLMKPPDHGIQWPNKRWGHSSVVINSVSSDGVRRHHLVVIGGKDENEVTCIIPDCWIMDIENKSWEKVIIIFLKLKHTLSVEF